MKTCARCHESKDESEFRIRMGKQGHKKPYAYCVQCEKDANKENREKNKDRRREQEKKWQESHRERMRELTNASTARMRERNKKWLMENFKVECQVCGFNKSFSAIDGHHLDPSQKDHQGDSLGNWLKGSLEKLQTKMSKADIVFLCRNCHSMLHAGEITLEGTL